MNGIQKIYDYRSIHVILFTLLVNAASQDIRQPPDLTQSPPKYKVFRPRTEDVELTCLFSGVPEPSVEWMKDNKTLILNDPNIDVIDKGRKISIKVASSANDGIYQCIVSNQYGKAMSDYSHLQMAYVGSFKDTEVRTYGVTEGMNFTLPCLDPPESVPTKVFMWQSATDNSDRSPVDIPLTKRMQIDEKGNLHFAYITDKDDLGGRVYRCKVFNPSGDFTIGGSYSSLTINPANGAKLPAAPFLMFSSPDNLLGVVSQNISFRCFFAANPEAEIIWIKEGGSLPYGRSDSKYSELLLKNLAPEDAGTYTCQGRSNNVMSSKSFKLTIESAPVFNSTIDRVQNVNAAEGESVTFRCAAHAIPAATITWYRNTEPLNRNTLPAKYSMSADGLSLTISNVCKSCPTDDLAVIQCRASNVHGSAFSQGYINVLVATKVIAESQTIPYEPDKELAFPCTVVYDASIKDISFTWYFQSQSAADRVRIIYDNNIYFENQTLHILTKNDADSGLGRVGEYTCEVNGGPIRGASITHTYFNPAPIVQAASLWWIGVIVAAIIFLLILILICFICMKRNKGDSYFVDEKERHNGNDPEQELLKDGFQDYQRPTGFHINAEHGSISGSTGNPYNEDDSSLNAYAMSDPGKFQEDGSFIGQYNTNRSVRNAQ